MFALHRASIHYRHLVKDIKNMCISDFISIWWWACSSSPIKAFCTWHSKSENLQCFLTGYCCIHVVWHIIECIYMYIHSVSHTHVAIGPSHWQCVVSYKVQGRVRETETPHQNWQELKRYASYMYMYIYIVYKYYYGLTLMTEPASYPWRFYCISRKTRCNTMWKNATKGFRSIPIWKWKVSLKRPRLALHCQ